MTILTSDSIIGVIGAGTMGAGIAQVAAKAGHPVILFDASEGAAEAGIYRLEKGLDRLVKRGKMTQTEVDSLVARIQVGKSLQSMTNAALVIEAVVEKLAVKQQIFGDLEAICGESTILATNTSSISITAIGSALKRPQQLLGMHFFNPAPVMKLVEVIRGLDTSDEVCNLIQDLSLRWGKQPVQAKSTPGFIVNRVARPYYAEALRILQEGGSDSVTLDALLREAGGFPMGPFELMDLIGHDVNYAVTTSVFDAYYQDPRFLPSLIQKELVDAGYLGRKTGRGFYDYGDQASKPTPNTALQAPRPDAITIEGNLGIAEALIPLFEQAGIVIRRSQEESGSSTGCIQVGDATLMLTDGQFTTAKAAQTGTPNLIYFDLALDYPSARRIALAPADSTTTRATQSAVGLFQTLDKAVSLIDDVPGMVVMRTLSMLANEGFDAVNQQVCDFAAVDTAMKAGVNYPLGPLEWADRVGLGAILGVLDHLAATYGEDRYRASPLLRRRVAEQQINCET